MNRASGPLDYRSLSEFRYQLRCFLLFSEQKARDAGIEPQQHQLLLALKGLPEGKRPTLGVLADRLQLKHHTVVGLADRLVRRKLVVRRKSPEDGREILLEATAGGERLLERLSEAHRAELSAAAPALVRALEALIMKPAGPNGRSRARLAAPAARSRHGAPPR